MKTLRVVKYSLLAALIVAFALLLHYNLPRVEVVHITGTDIKRIDRPDPARGTQTRDVRYLSALTRDGEVRVFRNEDTGWGWPPYLKFDSADLTALAQSLLRSPDNPWVRVRYYGWRIQIFSLFPNATSLKVVDEDYEHFPWFNLIFLILLAIALALVALLIRRLVYRVRNNERIQSVTGSLRDRFR